MMKAAQNENKIRVMTASEFKTKIREGKIPAIDEIDAVTCGTFGIMSGTIAVFSFQATEAGVFGKAKSVFFNGVPTVIGPCPNENNGFIDLIVLGTAVSKDSEKYGGGRLFKDLVLRRAILAEIETDNDSFTKTLTIDDFNTARIILTRGAFKNYTAFVNVSDESVSTIFSVRPLKGESEEATVSGCGEINPLQNDPFLKHHKPGTFVLINGAPGIIIGTGTRSTKDKPNLSAAADMFEMNPDLMGGFVTAKGAECLTSVASVIPITDTETYAALQITDEKISLPIIDVSSRRIVAETTYAAVWKGVDAEISVSPEKCNRCGECAAAAFCPTGAISDSCIVSDECVFCLSCTSACPNGVFTADGGSLFVNGKTVPIRLRQSDRRRGEKAASLLKSEIEFGRWVI
ncbi:hypothetical protein MmiEs2_02270 [Methanimicrococcus stummii]|uniref:4Fe-4S ferredoxin-type domain-containing protein n=1 Tax=Methanimicrococcus stummii TaxID=3028294 RepID=A0AA96V794_9EURY|nr:methanogenesis marker 16 metalloprotein [Methanimicrococcus sp. Es2]WNY28047.1 hypothetical protein MmiEs2_02270 [Methanimicrococcus sp. Es2]